MLESSLSARNRKDDSLVVVYALHIILNECYYETLQSNAKVQLHWTSKRGERWQREISVVQEGPEYSNNTKEKMANTSEIKRKTNDHISQRGSHNVILGEHYSSGFSRCTPKASYIPITSLFCYFSYATQ